MQIYYKCGCGFRQQAANWSCRKANQKKITITDELINQMFQWPKLMHKAEDFKQKLKKIAVSKPHTAIELISRFWYYDYAREKELDIGKVDILYSLAVREDTIEGFLDRLAKLPQLIEEYKCTDDNPVILSTIHSAKGLEFDTVYIVDVYDGCLPHYDRETAKEQEKIDNYEEERRLFPILKQASIPTWRSIRTRPSKMLFPTWVRRNVSLTSIMPIRTAQRLPKKFSQAG